MKHSPNISRRELVVGGASTLTVLGLGCSGSAEEDPSGNDGGGTAPPSDGGAETDSGATADSGTTTEGGAPPEPACEPTGPDIEGPFFKPESPERRSLADESEPGQRLILSGRVLDAECRPLPGVVLDFWQADAEGDYDQDGFHLRGHQLTDADGGYELSTILPGHYLNGPQFRPAHLHLNVHVRGELVLTTQLYFEDDPYNDIDPWFDEERAIALEDGDDGRLTGVLDIVVTG